MNRLPVLSSLIFAAFYSIPSWAAESPAGANATSMLAAKVIIGLTLMIVLIATFAWLAKKLGYASFGVNHCNMTVLASVPLGARERAVVVEAAGKLVLLGVAPGSVNPLYTYTEEEKIAALNSFQLNTKQSTAGAGSFSQALKMMLSKQGSGE